MTRRPKTIAFWVGRLPHWEVVDGHYFITLHVAGAIPQAGRERLRRMSTELSQKVCRSSPQWLRRQRDIFREMESWLDRSQWNPWLSNPRITEIVVEALEHYHGARDWDVHRYVVMPTHLHLFCDIAAGKMKSLLNNFKRWTGRQAAKILRTKGQRFWQNEWLDHWSRSDAEDERIVRYIENNPLKAGLVADAKQWPHVGQFVPN